MGLKNPALWVETIHTANSAMEELQGEVFLCAITFLRAPKAKFTKNLS